MTRISLFATSARRPLLLVPSLVLGLSLLSCGREVTGPEGGLRQAAFALDPRMPAAFAVEGAGDVVPFDRVRVTLERLSGELVKEEIVPFAAGTESVELSLEVTLPFGTTSEGIDLTLNMQYINAQGDTVFRAGPQTVTAVPVSAGTPTPVVPVEVLYVGTGANATAVTLSPSGGQVVSGTTTTFTAVATDATEATIPNTPVIFSSPDVTMVSVAPAGVATWLAVRGTARVIATLPTNADADTVSFTVTLPATKLAIVSGNGQAGEPAQPLESPLVLRVTASDDVPVAGVTVTFAVSTGGGSVTPLTAVSDANGLVITSWTLGSAPGAQSITANFTGLVGGALTLNANGTQPPPTGVATWTGAVSQDFSVPGNWASSVAPTTTDSVIIPAGAPRYPILTAFTTVGAVEIQAGSLTMGGQALTTAGDFVTSNSGVLEMQTASDVLVIGGDAVFAGGDESGLITAGGISVVGNFTQAGTNSPASFQAGPAVNVVLLGTNTTVTFSNPGPNASQSRFGNLVWSGTGTMTQNNGVSVSGSFATTATTPITHLGIGGVAGRYLEFAQYFNAGPVVFDNIRVSVYQPLEAEPVTINNATLRNLPATATQLFVVTPGGFDITLDNVVFETTPTTGVYIHANDLTPADGQQLVVNVANPSPAAPGGFISVFAGAVINWPAGVERTWIGTTSTAWTTASNWFPAAVPGPMDDVIIAPGMPFQPTSNTDVSLRSLNVPAGATVTVSSGTMTVNGDIVSDGNVLVDEFIAGFRPNGIGRTIRGNFQNIDVRGAYSLSGMLNVANDIFIRGSLTVAGETIATGGDLGLLSAGVIVMQNSEDLVMIGGQALFTGGSTEGLLTNGVLEVQGRFLQNNNGTGNPANSFAPSGAHTVRLAGVATQEVDIFNTGSGPGTSHFANLDVSTKPASVDFSRFNTVYVTGMLISQPQGGEATLTSSNSARLQVGGVNVNRLRILGLPLTVNGGTLTQFDNVLFSGMPTAESQLRIDNPGSAAPFTMTGLTFNTVPTTGGFYLDANDTDGATPAQLSIIMSGANPAIPGSFVRATNGANVDWTLPSDVRLWTGAASTDWTNTANWSGGVVPQVTDSVRITAAAPNDPVLVNPVVLRAITVETGATLDLAESSLTVSGHVNVPATPSVTADGEGQFRMTGPAIANVSGALPGAQVLGGTYTVSGPTTINGDLLIDDGFLNMTGAALAVAGDLTTSGVGVLIMSGPADVTVAGNATFDGGGTDDLMTGGTLFIGGNFSQGGVDQRSFAAGPGHTVVLNGTTPQTVTFATPDVNPGTACALSCFGALRTTRQPADGGVQFLSSAKAVTQLELSAEVIDATGFTLLSGGTPDITALNFTAAKLGFVTGINRNVELWTVDSLIGMGNGFTLPSGLSTPTRLAGSYTIAGTHNAGLVVTFGALGVSGRSVINGDLVTRENGWLQMDQASDTVIVNGNTSFGGNTPITQLTNGILRVNGNFSQVGGAAVSFLPDALHKTVIEGPGATVSLANPGGNRLGTLEFNTSGAQMTTSATVLGHVIVRTSSGPVTGADIIPLQFIQINGGLYDTTGGQWQVRNTRFNNANPDLPATMASNIYFAEPATLSHDVTFTGELNIVQNGLLHLNGNRVSVLGEFRTNQDGRVRMDDAADTLSLSSLASWGGGTTTGLLTAGTIELYGAFQQVGNPAAFAPSGTHTTYMFGETTQGVNFANPGTGAGASHFNHLVLAQGNEGASVNLLSDAWADGQIITQASPSRRISAATSRLFHSRGASIGGSANMEFSNVRWALTDGAAAAVDGLRFTAMDPAAIQFSILRTGPTLALANIEFETTPTGAGRYMNVQDSDGAANGELVVAITGVTPPTHGGFLTAVLPATVTGWSQDPEFVWTGAESQDWATPTNWSGGSVPGAADSAFIAAGMPNQPILNGLDSVRTVALQAGATLLLLSDLWVHGSVDVPPTASISSDGGTLYLSNAAGGTINGALPPLRVLGGLFTLDGNVSINGNLEIAGNEFTPGIPVEGNVSIGNFTLTSTGGLLVNEQGTFTMTGTGVADFGTYANFFGNSTAGRLTNGTLRIGTEFFQDGTDSPSSFQASGTHVTEFAGASPQPRIVFDTPDITPTATCAASCFATLRSVKAPGEGGLRFETGAKITGTLQLQADSVSAPGFMIMAAGSPTFDTPILRAGAIGHEGTITQNAATIQVDSLVAWGVGQVLGSIPGVRTVVTGSYTLDNVAFPSLLEVDGSVAIANNVSIASNLHVDGTVSLTAGDTPALLTVNGNLFVRGPSSALISSGQPHVIDVTGSATFNGANSTGNLVAGRLRVASNFASQAFVSPLSFVAGPAYVVEFTGPGTIGISNPALSTFGAIDFSNTGFSRTLNTDIHATGLVSLSASSFTLASFAGGAGNTRRIFADRVEANGTGFSMFNVAITTRSFNSGVSGSINFNNFDPSVIQLEIAEGSSLGSLLRNAAFATVPTGAGRYVRVSDATPAGGDGSPTLVVQTPSPIFHGGAAEAVAPATMTGWDPAPNFRWTGAVDNAWTQPGNWADNIVPGVADSVYITDGYVNPPAFPGQVTLRSFVTDVTSFLNMSGELRVTERLVTNANMDCDGGEIILAGGVTPVTFSGDITCGSVRISSGTAVPDGRVTVGSDLMVWGVDGPAELVLNRNTIVAPFFHTIGQGTLRMTEATDSLITQAATFGGASTNNQLTDGVLVVTGNFTQDGSNNAESFAASGNHTTVFAGNAGNQQSFFATPGEGAGTSHFANVEMSKGEVNTHVVLGSRTFALGTLRTGNAVAQRFLANLTEPTTESVLFQSHGGDVEGITFSNVKWSILDGAPIGRMDNITFAGTDSASTRLNIERAADDITIRNIDFGGVEPQEGLYLRLHDTNGAGFGLFRVTMDVVSPAFHNLRVLIENGAQLLDWIAG